jgi:uncharacterized protein (TIGR03083 family)
MATDQELVETLDELWRSIEEFGQELDEVDWKRPTECPGWTVQDNLVHLTALERFILGDPLPSEDVPDDLPHVKNDIGKANERWIESRRSWTGADALAEFHAATRARIEQLRALEPSGFDADSWTPMGPGTVRDLIPFRIFDSWVHAQDMLRAVDRRDHLDSAAADPTRGMMGGVLPYVVGKKVGAPDGSTIVLVLTGPLARTVALEVTGGRARVLETVPDSPTVALTLESDAYARLACGRTDPGEALALGAVAIDGDAELGGKIVHQLNYMF